jgi:hypothetical protein
MTNLDTKFRLLRKRIIAIKNELTVLDSLVAQMQEELGLSQYKVNGKLPEPEDFTDFHEQLIKNIPEDNTECPF